MSVIQNGLSGALVAQAALNTTSQNVANVMTPGYTRQGVVISSLQTNIIGAMSAGAGATVSSLIRFSDSYKSQQMWQAASNLGQHDAPQTYLTQLEQVMGDDSASINTGLDELFAALNAASVEPTSSPLRQQVLTTANALTQRFASLNTVLSGQRSSVNQQRSAIVTQLNGLSSSIATLNQKIASTLASGANASGLIDERDQKIDSLSSLVGVQVVDQPDGTRSVSLRGGQPLVVGNMASTMSTVIDPATAVQSLQLDFASESFKLTGQNLGGQLGGLNNFEQNVLAPMMQSVSDTAQAVATQFNSQLTAGYAMDGTPGKPLFVYDPTSSSGMLKVDGTLVAQDLAFSSDATTPGNSDNLLSLINLVKQPVAITSLGTVQLGDVYTQLVGKLAMDSQQNQASQTTAQTVRTQAETNWKSTSAVNNDEEAINLMQYQQMYQANMKVISVANTLFDSTLSMMG